MFSSQNQVRTDLNRLYLDFMSYVKLTKCCSQNSDVFYFGGPLLGINDPSLRCNSEILTNSDGTRVAFMADPRPLASRNLGTPVEAGEEGLFTEADPDHKLGDARNPFEDAETGHDETGEDSDGGAGGSAVSFSFFHSYPRQLLNTTFGTHTTTTQFHILTPTQQQPHNTTFPHPPYNNNSILHSAPTHRHIQQILPQWPTVKTTRNFTNWQILLSPILLQRCCNKLTRQHHSRLMQQRSSPHRPKARRVMVVMDRRPRHHPAKGLLLSPPQQHLVSSLPKQP